MSPILIIESVSDRGVRQTRRVPVARFLRLRQLERMYCWCAGYALPPPVTPLGLQRARIGTRVRWIKARRWADEIRKRLIVE